MAILEDNNLGIGTDIENIDRFRKLDKDKDKLFFEKVFTKKELDYCFSKKDFAPHLAARFAGKEAVLKALSSLEHLNLNYREIEILNNKNKVPRVEIKKVGFNNLAIHLSLSHSEDKALAFALVLVDNH